MKNSLVILGLLALCLIVAQLCRYQVQIVSSPIEPSYVVRLDRLTGNIQCDRAKFLTQP